MFVIRFFNSLATLGIVLVLLVTFGTACMSNNGTLSTIDNPFDQVSTKNWVMEYNDGPTPEYAESNEIPGVEQQAYRVNEQEAMQIAELDLDPRFWEATSVIVGPMEWVGEEIDAYEVTVKGDDTFLLRYIDANSGEFLYDEEFRMEPGSGEESEERDWIRWCPSGWPLCIQDPGTITFYSQRDPTWSGDQLGYSTLTIGSHGCLLSAYAMSLQQTGHGTRNPRVLNNLGKQYACFDGALVKSGCIANVTGASYTTIGVNQVWQKIAQGIPVVVHGRSPCLGGMHAQMIWGHDGSRYWTKDPWYDWSDQDKPMCMTSNITYRVMQ